MNKNQANEQNMGKYRFVYQGKTTYYTREFTDSEKGQVFLKKMYKDKESLEIYCTCSKKETIEMHLVKYGNGRSFGIRTNQGKRYKHRENCAHYVVFFNDVQNEAQGKNEEKAKNYKTSLITGKNGQTYANLHINNFFENDLKRNKAVTLSQSNKKTDNRYSGMFMLGEIALSTGWKNALRSMKINPKVGNVFHFIHNNADKYPVRENVSLANILYDPIKPGEEKDLTNHMVEKYYEVKYELNKKGYKNGKLYFLMKLLSYDSLEGNEEVYRIKLHDPYHKGEFVVYCKKDRFKRAYNTHKVFGSDKYISAFVNLDYVKSEPRVMIEHIAVIPVLKGYGLYMESNDEIKFANYLVNQKIRFERPPKSCKKHEEDWKGYVPDFLFLNPTTLKVTTIAEVFGFWTDEYKSQMVKKINYYSKQPYSFVCWKSNENEPMPKLEKKTGRQIFEKPEEKTTSTKEEVTKGGNQNGKNDGSMGK